MVLKEKGLLEKEFAKDGISIRWVQSAGSNKALEFLNAGSIDFGSTAGAAALVAKINGNPIKSIYVYSRPEWTALVTRKDIRRSPSVADLKGKRVAVTRGTDPHIFLVRALLDAGLTEKDITLVLLQHADGKTGADPRRRRRLGRPRPDDGAGRGRGAAPSCSIRKAEANTWGVLNVREAVRQGASRRSSARARGLRGGAQIVARQSRRAEEDLHRRRPSCPTPSSTSSSGAHRADPQPHRRAAARDPSSPPASRCRRPA